MELLRSLVQKAISELRAEADPEWAADRRRNYLVSQMASRVVAIWEMMDRYEQHKTLGQTMDMILSGDKIEEHAKRIVKMQDELYFRRQTKKIADITPDMIERAKAYPFEELHQFKRNMALCPFHNDGSPSMSLKNNKAHCWGVCGQSWDTIDFVMKRDGLNFRDAVIRLQ